MDKINFNNAIYKIFISVAKQTRKRSFFVLFVFKFLKLNLFFSFLSDIDDCVLKKEEK